MTTSNKPTVKSAARLDASLLLARKGEAAPSVAATQHNNPGLAWGAPAHPADFQPAATAQEHASHRGPQHAPQHAGSSHSGALGTVTRLRPDSFFAHASGHASNQASNHASNQARGVVGQAIRTRAAVERDPVALTMRVEDDTYLRLKYLAQSSGRSTQQVLAEALDDHLITSGVPHSRKLVVKPE